jgi:predicted phage-related endonuclease
MQVTQIPKPEHGSLEWLRLRWRDEQGLSRVSASVAACVHGEHEFKSAADFAVELMSDDVETTETTQAMERGNRLEPVIIEWSSSLLGKKLTTPDTMYVYNEPGVRLIATLDAVDEDGAVYEVKTKRGRWDGKLPRYWYWQGVQQAICANVDEITWVIFDSDLEIHFHTQHVSSDEKQYHKTQVREFLGSVDLGEIPEVAHMGYENVVKLWKDANDPENTVEVDADIVPLVMRLEDIKQEKHRLNETEDAIKAAIGSMLKGAEYGTYDGNLVVTWKKQNRKSFDFKKFQSEHPALAEKYNKTTTMRVMRTILKGDSK